MDIDFPLVLVVLTFATGLIWLADKLFLRERRLSAYRASGASGEVGEGSSEESEEPKSPTWST